MPPPFAVGTRLRYLGTSEARQAKRGAFPEELEYIIRPGIEVTIAEVKPGRRGTGRVTVDPEDGYEIVHETKDGYSIYRTAGGNGRIIFPYNAGEWEVIE